MINLVILQLPPHGKNRIFISYGIESPQGIFSCIYIPDGNHIHKKIHQPVKGLTPSVDSQIGHKISKIRLFYHVPFTVDLSEPEKNTTHTLQIFIDKFFRFPLPYLQHGILKSRQIFRFFQASEHFIKMSGVRFFSFPQQFCLFRYFSDKGQAASLPFFTAVLIRKNVEYIENQYGNTARHIDVKNNFRLK